MPKKLDDFPQANWSKYNWEKLLNGDPWLMVQGEDYSCTTHGFAASAYQAAKRKGGQLRTRMPDGEKGDKIIIQFQER